MKYNTINNTAVFLSIFFLIPIIKIIITVTIVKYPVVGSISEDSKKLGLNIGPTPKTRVKSVMLLPIMFPKNNSCSPFLKALIPTKSSGRLVPTLTIKKLNTNSGIPISRLT